MLKKAGLNFSAIQPLPLSQVTGVSGEKVNVLGRISVPIVIAGICFPYDCHILESLHHSLIIGVDFLYEYKCFVDLSQGKLHLQDHLASVNLIIKSGCAKTNKPFYITARQEVVIPVSVTRTLKREIFLLEPVQNDKNFRVARCLVKPKRNKKTKCGSAVVRILKPTFEDIHLPINYVVATVSKVEISQIFEIDETNCLNNSNNNMFSSNSAQSRSADDITFNISNPELSAQQRSKLEKFLKENLDVFSTSLASICKTNVFKHTKETEPYARPVHLNHYRQGPIQKAEIERPTKDMLEQGIIRTSSSVWNSPVVLVKKKNNTWRFAVDYRKLNQITKSISHPLPRLEDVFDCIGESSATIFSTLDLNSAYFQMELGIKVHLSHTKGFSNLIDFPSV